MSTIDLFKLWRLYTELTEDDLRAAREEVGKRRVVIDGPEPDHELLDETMEFLRAHDVEPNNALVGEPWRSLLTVAKEADRVAMHEALTTILETLGPLELAGMSKMQQAATMKCHRIAIDVLRKYRRDDDGKPAGVVFETDAVAMKIEHAVCPTCNGAGKVESGETDINGDHWLDKCRSCNGTGRVPMVEPAPVEDQVTVEQVPGAESVNG